MGVSEATASEQLVAANNNLHQCIKAINRALIRELIAEPSLSRQQLWSYWRSPILVEVNNWLMMNDGVLQANREGTVMWKGSGTGIIESGTDLSPSSFNGGGRKKYTVYVVEVVFSKVAWHVLLRYSDFENLFLIVNKFEWYSPLKNKFPQAEGIISSRIKGLKGEILYNFRMQRFDLWLQELITNPVLMTVKDLYDAVDSKLQISAKLRDKK
jgi:hypothetical protein